VTIRIEHGPTKIECDDVAQAAQLVNMLLGSSAPAAGREPKARRAPKVPRAKKARSSNRRAKTAARSVMSEHSAKIVAFVQKKGKATLYELARHLYDDESTQARARTNVALGKLAKNGYVKRTGRGEYGPA
jgi:predicted HTH transcriptional regulator